MPVGEDAEVEHIDQFRVRYAVSGITQDYTFAIAYNVLKEADIYVGGRFVKGEFDNGTQQIFDNGLNLGVNIRF